MGSLNSYHCIKTHLLPYCAILYLLMQLSQTTEFNVDCISVLIYYLLVNCKTVNLPQLEVILQLYDCIVIIKF